MKTKRKPFYSVLGGLLRMRREQLNLTQKEVATRLNMTDSTSVSGFETGKKPPTAKHLPKLAVLLNINPHQVALAFELDKVRRTEAAHWVALNKRTGLA